MAKFKIEFKKADCIGCGACTSICDNWELVEGDEYKARPKKTELDDIGCNKEAEDVCPVNCIKVKEVK